MKKAIISVLSVLVFCLMLCACGSADPYLQGGHSATPAVTADLLPSESPLISPDPEDGYVEDQDGILEGKKTEEKKAEGGKDQVGPSATAGTEKN